MPLPFLNPWLLTALAGVAIPVVIHLLNRQRARTIEWAAMELLRRAVKVRSRQLRLQDILLMLLRCLIVLLVVLALARPTTRAPIGQADVGAVLAIDTSFSMGARPATRSRLDDALDQARVILATIKPGNPVTLLTLADQPKVLVRGARYEPAKFEALLRTITPSAGGLNLEAGLDAMGELVGDLKSPQHELYILTDGQAATWGRLSDRARAQLAQLGKAARLSIVAPPDADQAPVNNLAITRFELASGSLRVGSLVRMVAQVENLGPTPREGGELVLSADGTPIDRQFVGRLAPGQAQAVPLYVPLTKAGEMRLSVALPPDALPADSSRFAVLQVHKSLRVLVVTSEGGEGRLAAGGRLIATALSPRAPDATDQGVDVTILPWLGLPTARFTDFDLIVLANVPDVPEEKAQALWDFVNQGGGLIVFVGDAVNPDALNRKLQHADVPLLAAELTAAIDDAAAPAPGGLPLDPVLADHPLLRPLRGLAPDLIAGARIDRLMRVKPYPDSRVLLKVAGTGDPVLLERTVGQGRSLLWTTSADRRWSNLALSPVYPILLQQAVTYLTRRPTERELLVGESFAVALPAGNSDATVRLLDPAGQVRVIATAVSGGTAVADIGHTEQAGFFAVQTAVGEPVATVAVNVDPAESDIRALAERDLAATVADLGAGVLTDRTQIAAAIGQSRQGRELWHYLALAALGLLAVESLVAGRFSRKHAAVQPVIEAAQAA